MKVGILTFHHTTNYGATLQAYALWSTVKSLGFEAEVIDYRPYRAVYFYLKETFPIYFYNKKLLKNRWFIYSLLKAWNMRKFLQEKIKLSSRIFYRKSGLKFYSETYDLVICGSDQVWCLDPFIRGFDPSYFLDFVDDKSKKISYAASFGNTSDLGEHKYSICNHIAKFDDISVRDTNSKRLIENECNRSAKIVVDPTFLVNYDEIIDLPNSSQEDYLLVYIPSGLTKEQYRIINSVAKIRQLIVISVGKYMPTATKNFIDISPEKWLGYFSQASFVITSTYHGSIFSIIYKKPFMVFGKKAKSNKVADLLSRLELGDIVISNLNDYELIMQKSLNIDYQLVHENLKPEIDKSKEYLLNVLKS